MPMYVYRCEDGHETEVRHGMLEVIHILCPVCGGRMNRRPQAFQFNFKIEDSGQRNAKEINAHLETKYRANKERREIDEYNHRKVTNG